MTESGRAASTLDLKGVLCPMTWVKTRLAIERLEAGGELWLNLDSGEALESVPLAAREEGHAVEVRGNTVRIVKAAG